MGLRLTKVVERDLRIQVGPITFWSDSETVLGWIGQGLSIPNVRWQSSRWNLGRIRAGSMATRARHPQSSWRRQPRPPSSSAHKWTSLVKWTRIPQARRWVAYENRVHSSTQRPRNRITSDEIRGIRYQNGGIGNNLGSNSETDEFSRARHTNSGLDTHTVVPQEETTHHEHIITGHRQRPASPTRNQRIGSDANHCSQRNCYAVELKTIQNGRPISGGSLHRITPFIDATLAMLAPYWLEKSQTCKNMKI